MKLLRLFLIGLLALVLMTPMAMAQDDFKVGYVDLSRLFDEYHKTKSYDEKLEGQHKEFEDMRNERIEKIREEQGKVTLLAEDKRAEVEKNIEDMKAELLEFDRQKKQDLTKERNEKIREILLEIENKVSDYAEKNDYSLILNDRVLIYGSQTINLTEQVLKTLNVK